MKSLLFSALVEKHPGGSPGSNPRQLFQQHLFSTIKQASKKVDGEPMERLGLFLNRLAFESSLR